jgi:hypothetical protein
MNGRVSAAVIYPEGEGGNPAAVAFKETDVIGSPTGSGVPLERYSRYVSIASSLAAVSIEEALPIVLSVVGSVVFTGLLLCVRRFDSEHGPAGDGSDGGGGRREPPPRPPGPPGEPLAVIDPPLGAIRARRPRERVTS